MDDTAQKQTNDQTQVQTQPQPQVVDQTAIQAPAVPTGSPNKEVEMAPVSDFVKPTEKPAVRDQEVAEAGVSEVTERIELSKEHEKIGIKPSAEATPVKINDQAGEDNLPMTQVQAAQVVKKNKNIRSSIVWLAILMLKNFKKMRMSLLKKGI